MTELVTKSDLALSQENLKNSITLSLTLRLGPMYAAGIALLAALQRIH